MSAEAEKLFSGTGPSILTSRADSQRTRLASSAVAALYAHAGRSRAAVAA